VDLRRPIAAQKPEHFPRAEHAKDRCFHGDVLAEAFWSGLFMFHHWPPSDSAPVVDYPPGWRHVTRKDIMGMLRLGGDRKDRDARSNTVKRGL